MHISRAQWLDLASGNHTLRHIYSLCLLVTGGLVFSYKERRLATKLLQKLKTVVHQALADHATTRTIVPDFLELEAQVTKRLERQQPPHHATGTSKACQ